MAEVSFKSIQGTQRLVPPWQHELKTAGSAATAKEVTNEFKYLRLADSSCWDPS